MPVAAEPQSVISDGNILVLWVPAAGLADPDWPTLNELTDPDVFDPTDYLTDTGWAPALSEDAAVDNRLSSRQNYSKAGRQGWSMPIIYVTNPAEPDEDEAAQIFVEKADGWFVDRRGVDRYDPLAAGDVVTIFRAQLGAQADAPLAANVPQTITQMAYLRPPGRKFRRHVVAS